MTRAEHLRHLADCCAGTQRVPFLHEDDCVAFDPDANSGDLTYLVDAATHDLAICVILQRRILPGYDWLVGEQDGKPFVYIGHTGGEVVDVLHARGRSDNWRSLPRRWVASIAIILAEQIEKAA